MESRGSYLHATTGPDEADKRSPWDEFVLSRTVEERCRAWLELICQDVVGATAAATLVQGADGQSFVPLAVWPRPTQDMSRLAGVVEAVLRDRKAVVQPGETGALHIAYPLMLGQRIEGVVAVEATCSQAVAQQVLRDIHWGSAWLANLLAAHEHDEAVRGKERMVSVLETIAVALRHGKMHQAMFELVNSLRQHLDCARVALGIVDKSDVRLLALSEAASFEKNASLAKAYVNAMRESFDRNRVVSLHGDAPEEQDEKSPEHEALRRISGMGVVLSQPLVIGADCVGVLVLEREEQAFSDDDMAWLDAFAALLAPVIKQRRLAERSTWGRLRDEMHELLKRFFGPRHLVWKASAALVILITALMVLVPITYRVSAKTVVEGEIQRVAAAPLDGFIAVAHVRAGDMVKKGDALVQLDDRELLMEQARWNSERRQYADKLREAMAGHDLVAVQLTRAQLDQAEAQWKLATEKIRRSHIVAPFDGIVVSGDLHQKIGAPVQVGETLFEVAPLESYRVILQVDEREIRHVLTGQEGHLVITGIAGDPMPFRVSRVTPVATAQEGRNFFRVEADLADASPRLRPGMEGVGKIEVGSQSLWWVMTHSFADWLRLKLWTWMP